MNLVFLVQKVQIILFYHLHITRGGGGDRLKLEVEVEVGVMFEGIFGRGTI